MPSRTRVIEFDAGHRVLNHEGKCRRIHGHRYKIELTVSSTQLDSIGRVVDFSVLKERCGAWIDANWDHKLLLFSADPLAKIITAEDGLVIVDFNPTAENMAFALNKKFSELLRETGIHVTSIRVYETPNCWSDHVNLTFNYIPQKYGTPISPNTPGDFKGLYPQVHTNIANELPKQHPFSEFNF